MRNRTVTIFAVVLASAWMNSAQAQTPAAPTAAESSAATGWVDIGFRGSSVSGDEARFERYRDLRNGAPVSLFVSKETSKWWFNAGAANVGYRDQRYWANYRSGRAKVEFLWDSTPLNYIYDSPLAWRESSSGVFTLDPATRLAVQNRVAGVVGIPTTQAQAAQGSIYRGLTQAFDIDSRRDVAGLGLTFQATQRLDVNLNVQTTKRSGHQPFGASFAFNDANEVPLPIDNRTNDVSASLEWANPKAMLRVGWDGSWFTNDVSSLVWDNPLRATDFSNGLLPPSGPWDPSGYSNGNGPAQGRMSTWPTNSMSRVSATGLYKLPRRTTFNAAASFTSNRQDDELIPWTTNQVILNADSFFRTLERQSAEAKVHATNVSLGLTSRPSRKVGFSARYRYDDHNNLTPGFDGVEYVRFDAVPEETGAESEPHDITRNTFDSAVTFNVIRYTALRLGYTYDHWDRSGRSYSGMRDNSFKVSADTTGNPYVMFRVMYEYTTREGAGFSESALEDGGAQPGLRFYDEANRDRNRATVLASVSPNSFFDVTGSVALGRDNYKGPGHEFGLLDSDTTSFNAGANAYPTDKVTLGFNVGRDLYSAYQESRNANPDCTLVPPCPASGYNSWVDPNRTWSLDNDETVNTVDVFVDLIKAVDKTDIRLNYNFSDSDNAFVHGGPRVQALRTNAILTTGDTAPCAAGLTSCFEALPNVTNQWQRLSADVRYYLTPKFGVGVAYWFEKLTVSDFATANLPGTDTPRPDYLGGLTTGYGNRPYKVSTGFLRIIYTF